MLTRFDKLVADKWFIPSDRSEELFAPMGSALFVEGAAGSASAKINGIFAATDDMFDRATVFKVGGSSA